MNFLKKSIEDLQTYKTPQTIIDYIDSQKIKSIYIMNKHNQWYDDKLKTMSDYKDVYENLYHRPLRFSDQGAIEKVACYKSSKLSLWKKFKKFLADFFNTNPI